MSNVVFSSTVISSTPLSRMPNNGSTKLSQGKDTRPKDDEFQSREVLKKSYGLDDKDISDASAKEGRELMDLSADGNFSPSHTHSSDVLKRAKLTAESLAAIREYLKAQVTVSASPTSSVLAPNDSLAGMRLES